MQTTEAGICKIIYWHQELPPIHAKALGEHVVEAASEHIANTLVHRDELWHQCYGNLMSNARARIEQEVVRLGGRCAHVLDESVDSRSNDVSREAWLHGRFTYMLYGDESNHGA
jgi:hypothetical protein